MQQRAAFASEVKALRLKPDQGASAAIRSALQRKPTMSHSRLSSASPQASIRRYLRHGTLPQLAVFEAVARLGSFTRAGEELHLAQPTVSVQIRKLSETVGTPLLELVGKQIHLTEAGRALYAASEQIFGVFKSVENQLLDTRGLKAGRLRLGATTAIKHFAPRLLAAFVRAHPGIEVALEIQNRQNLTARLAANADDVYLFARPPGDIGVVAEPLLANPLVIVAPAGHPLHVADTLPFACLAEEFFLLREAGSETHLAARALFIAHGLKPRVRMELSSNDAIREAVLAGLGLALLPRHTFSAAATSASLVELPVEGLPLDMHWHLVHAKGKQISPAAQHFIAFARAHAQALVASACSATAPAPAPRRRQKNAVIGAPPPPFAIEGSPALP